MTTPQPLDIPTEYLPRFEHGRPIHARIAATGGEPPYTFTVASGAFPAGVVLERDGTLSGEPRPDARGGKVFVRVTDNNGRELTRAFDIEMNPPRRSMRE
jgi:hypothetical protein